MLIGVNERNCFVYNALHSLYVYGTTWLLELIYLCTWETSSLLLHNLLVLFLMWCPNRVTKFSNDKRPAYFFWHLYLLARSVSHKGIQQILMELLRFPWLIANWTRSKVKTSLLRIQLFAGCPHLAAWSRCNQLTPSYCIFYSPPFSERSKAASF